MSSLMQLLVGTVFGALAGFGSQIFAARVLGADNYGLLAASMSLAMLFVPFGAFGVGGVLLKRYGESEALGRAWLPSLLKFSLTSALLASVACALALFFFLELQQAVVVGLGISLIVIAGAATEVAGAQLQIRRNYKKLAIVQFLPNAARLGAFAVAGAAVGTSMNISTFSILVGVASLTVIIWCGLEITRFLTSPFIHDENSLVIRPVDERRQPSYKELLHSAAPFGVGGFLYLVYHQSNIFLLGAISGGREAGLYGAAFIVISAVYLLPTTIFQKFLLPKLHTWGYHNTRFLAKTLFFGCLLMLFTGLLTTIVVVLSAETVINRALGATYADSVELLQLLAVCITLRFVSTCAGAIVSVRDEMTRKVKIMAVVAGASAILSMALIPTFGALGAVISAIVSELLLMLGYLLHASRFIKLGKVE